eukprot:9481096-Pyramimonas_sp.AAC.1
MHLHSPSCCGTWPSRARLRATARRLSVWRCRFSATMTTGVWSFLGAMPGTSATTMLGTVLDGPASRFRTLSFRRSG